jgi:hypothetical protein
MNTLTVLYVLKLRHAVGPFVVHYKADRLLNHDFAEYDRNELEIFNPLNPELNPIC